MMMVSCGASSWIPMAELQEREQTVEEAWLGSWMKDFVEDFFLLMMKEILYSRKVGHFETTGSFLYCCLLQI